MNLSRPGCQSADAFGLRRLSLYLTYFSETLMPGELSALSGMNPDKAWAPFRGSDGRFVSRPTTIWELSSHQRDLNDPHPMIAAFFERLRAAEPGLQTLSRRAPAPEFSIVLVTRHAEEPAPAFIFEADQVSLLARLETTLQCQVFSSREPA